MALKTATLYAWLIFISFCIVTISIDYIMRVASDDFYTGGLSKTLWTTIPILGGLISLSILVSGAKNIRKNWRKICLIFLNALCGALLYFVVVFLYVIELGIDSL
ncbi:hypothetical protein O5O45_27935 [Hahella aquimaris]|uniref:hypothetical protein n=1 Tax=Hahella sp. HNIBRBA332 TaxID=3015983 RepID=UPI00273C2126|nr:hypothetical protein [Hahella sp. HNIBRBA332]WLQ13562.1 hypothetical protein O5O45_27935 [Hahella sp. HNIBRBA332]